MSLHMWEDWIVEVENMKEDTNVSILVLSVAVVLIQSLSIQPINSIDHL